MNDYQFSTTDWAIPKLNEIYSLSKIKLDLCFQRTACWSDSAKKSYIESMFNGVHPGTLILADVRSNSHRAKYFEDLFNEGKDYVSIDGNNRSVCIAEYLDNKFKAKVNGKLKFYKDLDINEQTEFNYKRLIIVSYEKIDKQGCSNVFISHNQSEKLGPQEVRNARIGILSDYVRELELKLRSSLKNFKHDNPKRKNDEFILDSICQQLSIDATTKKLRDLVWESNLDEFKFNKRFLEETLRLLKDVLSFEYGKRSHEALARDFILFRGMMEREGVKTSSNEELVEKFNSARKKLWLSSKKYPLKGGGEEAQYYIISGKPAEKKYYDARIKIMKDLFASLLVDGIIYKVDSRDIDGSDLKIRKELFDRQKGICIATSKTIMDFLDTQKWEVDHIIPISKGGADSIDNLQLIDKKFNRSKAANILVA